MAVAVQSPVRFSHCIGVMAQSGRGFDNPIDLVVGSTGIVYILNRSNWRNMEQVRSLRITCTTLDEQYLGDIAEQGTEDGQFIWPTSIAIDRHDNLYVSDEHRHDVQILRPDGSFAGKWGSFGSGPGQFNRPSGLAIDSQDRVIVVDHLNHRVQTLTLDGESIASWGTFGSGPGEFNMPWGVCVDGQDNVYVADWRNDRVQKFGPDGEYLLTFGSSGTGVGQLNRPAGVGVDADGIVYVADWNNHRIQVFEADGQPLTAMTGDGNLSKWGYEYLLGNSYLFDERAKAKSMEPEKWFWAPTAVKPDRFGHILVADTCRNRIQIYDKV